MPKSEKEQLRLCMKDSMKVLAKDIRAKVTTSCVYKKDNEYFWYIQDTPHLNNTRMVTIGIKPWHYDELVLSIAYPEETIHITDKLRWDGAYMAPCFIISQKAYELPIDTSGRIDFGKIPEMCKMILDDSMGCISEFWKNIENAYGDINEFHIQRASTDPLGAGLAHIDRKEYLQAIEQFRVAKKRRLAFHWCFGSTKRDLRDVLLDYCIVSQSGQKWTKEMVAPSI